MTGRGVRYCAAMDAEIADVVVMLTNEYAERTDEAIAGMAALGFQVVRIADEMGVVEGTIGAEQLHPLEALPFVSYVRTTLRYFANFPPGDPRDRDGR